MRPVLCALVLVACGGKRPAPEAPTPSNTTPEPTDVAAAPAPAEDPTAVCASRPDQFGPIQLTLAQGEQRHGFGVTALASAASSKDQPVEVCGVAGEQRWLLAATCADGSRPYRDRNQVRDSRKGSVGAGGRCDTIIDHYVVACPEASYDVFMDMYMCAEGEGF